MQIVLTGSSTHLICCITLKFSCVLRQSQSLGNHPSVKPSCSTASSRWRQENKWDGCSKQLLVSFWDLTLCCYRSAFVRDVEKPMFSFITVFKNTFSPSATQGTFSREYFLKLHCGLKEAYCYSVIIMPHSSPLSFSSVISHSLLNSATQTVIISCCSLSNADCVVFVLVFQVPLAVWEHLHVQGRSERVGSIKEQLELEGVQKDHQVHLSSEYIQDGTLDLGVISSMLWPNGKFRFTHSKSFSNERINFWCRTERLNPKQTFSPISRYVVCYTWRLFFFAFW